MKKIKTYIFIKTFDCWQFACAADLREAWLMMTKETVL